MSFDIKIIWPDENKTLELSLTGKKMDVHGQHGKSHILEAKNKEKWILKIFPRIIDNNEIDIMDLDIEGDTEQESRKLHFWRVLNEYVASQIAITLQLNVPEALIVTSSPVSKLRLEDDYKLKLREDEIILDDDEGSPETADELYRYHERDNYLIESSKNFDDLLASYSLTNRSTDVLGILIKFIPNSENLDQYLENNDFDKAMENIKKLDDGFRLLPFDTWLNDPDRNQGNYLVEKNTKNGLKAIYGLDYEMWSFGSDIWMDQDEVTKGRSYLTAVIHNATHLFDDRVMETIFNISSLNDDVLEELTLAPKIICKFLEYNIENGHLDSDERLKLLSIEENMWDFLAETRPRVETLTLRIIKQIGLPKHLKSLQKKLEEFEEESFDYFDDEDEDEEE
ncbi:MAG: hypothetical protein HeimC3_42270 [Candidatus Heimdallarchaeota archaeon LC_3]|nr:MAG: hypothetical protein HeimC3_42270 [Candidatus Heimdallarchaeota archaeon LC_3]